LPCWLMSVRSIQSIEWNPKISSSENELPEPWLSSHNAVAMPFHRLLTALVSRPGGQSATNALVALGACCYRTFLISTRRAASVFQNTFPGSKVRMLGLTQTLPSSALPCHRPGTSWVLNILFSIIIEPSCQATMHPISVANLATN
jgi:hypothetical protein